MGLRLSLLMILIPMLMLEDENIHSVKCLEDKDKDKLT